MNILSEIESLKADYKAANDLLEASASQADVLKQQLEQSATDAQALQAALTAKDGEITSLLAEIEAHKGKLASLEAANKTAEEKAVVKALTVERR